MALVVSEMKLSRSHENTASPPISIERLDAPLLETLYRLIEVLDDPLLLPCVAALTQQEIIFRLLARPHAWRLPTLVAESPSQQIARAVSWII